MGYTPKQAWSNAARLLTICLGFSADQKHRMIKVSQKYNDNNGYHEITLRLEVRHGALLQTGYPIVYENDLSTDSLIQLINEQANTKREGD
ncbi:MAG: hypothetical protein JKX76_03190 [Colwellia sp.]|nr:hypothetical protein [Colwellia sp.]